MNDNANKQIVSPGSLSFPVLILVLTLLFGFTFHNKPPAPMLFSFCSVLFGESRLKHCFVLFS
jgi:uncharacterized membrane protein